MPDREPYQAPTGHWGEDDDQRRMQDKVALVTGAGSGIGRATATLLASEGAMVLVADIDAHAAQAVAAEIGHAEPLILDVTDEDAWRRTTEEILARHGRLQVVVNNAGIPFGKPVADMSLQHGFGDIQDCTQESWVPPIPHRLRGARPRV